MQRKPPYPPPIRPRGALGLWLDAKLWWNSARNDGFGLLIALGCLLLVCMALVWDTVRAERMQRSQAQRTDAIISTLHEIGELTTQAETGQRGYFITGDRRYLAPYDAAKKKYRPALDRLRLYTADDAQTSSRDLVADIARLTDARFLELGDSVQLISQGSQEEARLRILSNSGQQTMEQLNRALTRFEDSERMQAFDAGQRAAAAEMRIVPGLVLLLLMILLVLALGMWQVRRLVDAEVRASSADELAAARDRADLLSRELNHRIKNLFAVVLAIVRMSGRGEVAARPALDRVATRISALLDAHQLTQSGGGAQGASLGKLIDTALAPYLSDENQCETGGPDLHLADDAALPLGLVLHEMATNAVKYGCWSQPGGRLTVNWTISDGNQAEMVWKEQCGFPVTAPEEGARQGFGTRLAESSARQLQGSIERRFAERGLILILRFPVSGKAQPETSA